MNSAVEQRKTGGRRGQGGMVLVMVLGVLAVCTLMVVHVMVVCEIISRESFVSATRSELKYQAESAADHAFWMHLTDRRLFSNRKLGVSDDSRVSYTDFEPWMADRRPHELFDANCQAYIGTVEKSIRVDKTDTFKQNIDPDDTEQLELVNNFLDVLNDYTDADSLVKLNGKEEDDYASEGLYAMPRNGPMQFREELYWLTGWQDAVLGEVTIVPPAGKSFSSTTKKPSFFSASAAEIQSLLDLTDSELETVLEAREQWFEDSIELADSLDSELLLEVMNNFNFTESNVVLITVSAASRNGDVRVVHNAVREADFSKSSIYGDKRSMTFSLWSRTVY